MVLLFAATGLGYDCSSGSGIGPIGTDPVLAVTGLEGGRVVVVDGTSQRVVGRRGLALRAQGYPGISPDSTVIYYTGFTSEASSAITVTAVDPSPQRGALDARDAQWRIRLARGSGARPVSGQTRPHRGSG